MSLTLVRDDDAALVRLTAPAARSLTDQIRVALDGTWQLVARAYAERADLALGYAGWDDYCRAEFGSARLRLPREERAEVVASLREQGLSLRAIASATGTSLNTVRGDLYQTDTPAGPQPEERCTQGVHVVDALTDSVPLEPSDDIRQADTTDPPAPRPTVVGLDGKRYTPEQPTRQAAPRRPPLTDAAQRAGFEFRRVVERLERIGSDDRFTANKEQVAAHLRGHLLYAVEVCQDLLDRLNHQSKED